MTLRRTLVLMTSLLLLAAACSSKPEQSAAPTGATPSAAKQKGSDEEAKTVDDKGGKAGTGRQTGGSDQQGSSGGRSKVTKKHGGGDAAGDDGGHGAAAYPAAGTYSYEQSGFEEFCQATSCDRKDLPAQQPVKVSYKKASDVSAIVVSEVRASQSRVARTTFRFTPKRALITAVFTHFEYEGFEFSDSYHPDPPVEALQFPLDSGSSWSGKWEDKTSGDYSISVGGQDTVAISGENVHAFRITTETNFRGQFEGRSVVTIWYDPATKTIVRSDGNLDVESQFGRYNTEFKTTLTAGPGY